MASGQLKRLPNKGIIGGVLAGVAEYFGWDVTLVRVGYVILSVISAGFPGTLVYVILWIIIPSR